MSTWRFNELGKTVSAHDVVAGKQEHPGVSIVVIGFPTEAACVVVECVGRYGREGPPIQEFVSGDVKAEEIFEHGWCLVGW